MKTNEILINNRVNNFDFLRFVASSLVIVSHSSALTGSGIDLFALISKGQETLGGVSVGVFFVISGYLICASFIKTHNILKYFYARILRIFPALVIVLIVTTFLIGPLITRLSFKEYILNQATLSYLKSVMLYPMQYSLPGVEFSNGKFGSVVNGSLWTLSFEFTCYILIGILGLTKLLNKKFVLILFLIALFVQCFQNLLFPAASTANFFPYINQAQFIKLGTQFLSGTVLYFYRENLVFSLKYFFFSIFVFLCSFYYGKGFGFLFPICGSYLIFYIAYNANIKLQNFSKYGDFSYGIYIYGFLVQQLVIKLFDGHMNNNMNWIISLPISILCGIFSWHLIEKKCLALKDRFTFK